MQKGIKNFTLFFVSCSLLSACTVTGSQDVQRLENQVMTQQQTIQQLNSQLSGVQPAQADTWMQIQTLRQEMASMRGILDNLENALAPIGGVQGLGDKLARQERALRLAESQLGLDLNLDEPALPTMNTTMPTSSYSPTSAMTPPQSTIAPSQPTSAPIQTGTQTDINDTAQLLYDAGIRAFNERRYTQAVTAFTDFINTFPQHTLISNAYYWQGEAYYQEKNYSAAALAYENVISKFPNSNRAPSAYLKQGMSFSELGKNDAAKERLNELVSKYPKAPETARAKQLISSL